MMKKLLQLYIVTMTVLFSSNSYAQSLIEKVGGIRTDFEIINDGNQLNIIDQVLLKRGISYSDYKIGTYAYGYGLQTFHLEFTTTETIKSTKRRFFYELILKNENKDVLLITKLSNIDLRGLSNGSDFRVYSINFQNIPMIILDKTKFIEINVKKYSSW